MTRRYIYLPFALLLLSLPSLAQQITATLVGTATDSSGAVVANAVITVTNSATNTVRDGKSDSAGSYTIPSLPAGDYTVTAELAGFQQQRVEHLILQVAQVARIDFELKPGNVQEAVTVSATAAQLQSENATVGTVIDSTKIVDLPLNGRNFIQLAQLVPGVNPGTPGSITVRRALGSVGGSDPSYGSTGASANGQRDTANRYFLDGVEMMNYDAVSYSFSPSIDSLSQFKVETSTYSSDSGGAPGGQINMILKSGVNQVKGTLWEFNRNNDLTQSYDAIAAKSATPPRLNRNQFGANVGGPVVIPKLYNGKDKTFFFFNWEQGYAAQGNSPSFLIVPPTGIRTGSFAGLTNARSGAAINLIDPFAPGIGFAGNQIPTSRLSPASLTFLKFMPQPNTQNGANNFVTNSYSAVSTQRSFTTRIDQNFGTHDTVSGHYVFNDTYSASIPFWGNDTDNNLARTNNVEASETHIFSPSMLNEFRFGWHRFPETETFGTTNNASLNVAQLMGLPLVSTDPLNAGPPAMSISGPDGAFSVYNLQRQIGPRNRSNGISQFTDAFSWQHGGHSFKFGGEIDKRLVTFQQSRNPRGNFNFTGIYTGSALADFMLGYIQSDGINPTETHTDLHDVAQAYYVQDDWKITPRLTMNLGLRYDYFAPYYQSNNLYADIYQNGFTVGPIVTPANSPYGRGLIQPDRNDFGPRFGFAYRPSFGGEWVVRGGYGIYYTSEVANAWFAMAEGDQATSGATLIGNTTGVPNVTFANPFPGANTASTALPFAVSNDQNLRDSYIQQWNFTIQRTLPGKVLLDVAYVGSKGTRLIVTYPDLNIPLVLVNPKTPGLASLNSRRPDQLFLRAVTADKSVGNSIYHALQAKGERKISHGFTLLSAYTWSKSISGPSDIGGQIGGGFNIGSPQNPYYMQGDRSISGFDVTQRFVATALYDMPFFKNSRGFVRAALGGWQVSTIVTAQSGFPSTVTDNVDTTGTGISSRVNQVSGLSGNLTPDQRTFQKWFNTNAFVVASPGTWGTSARTGAFRLPGLVSSDFSASKGFIFQETRRVEIRADFFNLFNHYNPDPTAVSVALNSATFGSIGGGVSGITTRVIQLGAKFNF